MNFHIVTIFPEAFESYINSSMLWKAQDRKKIKINFYDPRKYTKDKHKKVDARPYGGGPGMVLTAEPILLALKATSKSSGFTAGKRKNRTKIIILSPRGKQFTNKLAKDWAKKYKHLTLIAGHYEGIDARVKKILKAQEISIGPYTLTGGELPAMTIVDAVARQISGVLGDNQSLEENRVATGEVYTRPEVLTYGGKQYKVPGVLLTGHHAEIEKWKARQLTAKKHRI